MTKNLTVTAAATNSNFYFIDYHSLTPKQAEVMEAVNDASGYYRESLLKKFDQRSFQWLFKGDLLAIDEPCTCGKKDKCDHDRVVWMTAKGENLMGTKNTPREKKVRAISAKTTVTVTDDAVVIAQAAPPVEDVVVAEAETATVKTRRIKGSGKAKKIGKRAEKMIEQIIAEEIAAEIVD